MKKKRMRTRRYKKMSSQIHNIHPLNYSRKKCYRKLSDNFVFFFFSLVYINGLYNLKKEETKYISRKLVGQKYVTTPLKFFLWFGVDSVILKNENKKGEVFDLS